MAESTLFVFRSVLRICSYFNPRTPVGCDMRQASDDQSKAISIHAPQWGATWTCATSRAMMVYFNPRTPVGCDRASTGIAEAGMYFNPRTPVGCDLHLSADYYPIYNISIHAPQWGATCSSTPPSSHYSFQSTHPSGVRPAPSRHARQSDYFNPRTPVGCDTMR